MKKKITAVLAAVMLLTALTGCGRVKEEDIIGVWRISYFETEGGEKRQPDETDRMLGGYIEVTKEKFSIGYSIILINRDWEIKGSDQILVHATERFEEMIFTYSDGKLIYQNSETGEKEVFEKQP